MLTFALFMSARMGIYQEVIYAKYGKHAKEALYYSHCLPLAGFLLLYNGKQLMCVGIFLDLNLFGSYMMRLNYVYKETHRNMKCIIVSVLDSSNKHFQRKTEDKQMITYIEKNLDKLQ